MLRHTNTELIYELYGHPDDDAALDDMTSLGPARFPMPTPCGSRKTSPT